MTSIRIVPDALRYQAKAVTEAATKWDSARKQIEEHKMQEHAFGVLLDDIPALFNQISAQVVNHFNRSSATIRAAGEGLGNCATVYEQKDDEWYRQFGYEG